MIMIRDKEYPATHSMWTAWFAIDADGNVAIMECDDNGPAPLSAPREVESDLLILETLTEPESKIAYTDQQLSLMMGNSITPQEYIGKDYDYENIWGDLCEIDPQKLLLLKEAAASNPKNSLICISDKLNLWYVSFSLPHYLDNSGDSRYRPTQKRIKENNRSKSLYKKLFDDSVFKRMLYLSWPLRYDDDKRGNGCLMRFDFPMTLYFQDYDCREPAERIHMPSDDISVKEHHISESIRNTAIRLPLRFKDHEKIQITQYVVSHFYGSNADWQVDGMVAEIAKLPDGKYYFVGNGCFFEPIPLNEAFESHETRYTPDCKDYAYEYKINGKRGYLKFGDGPYEIAGSCETYEPKDSDVIERIENNDD